MTRAIDIPCPKCGAAVGVKCLNAKGLPFASRFDAHHARRVNARITRPDARAAVALAEDLKQKAAAIRAANHQISIDEAQGAFLAAAMRGLPTIVGALLKAGRK